MAAERRRVKPGGNGLRWRITAAILLAASLPLALAGVGVWVVFRGVLEEKSLELYRAMVQNRAWLIDSQLTERLRALDLSMRSRSLQSLTAPGRVAELLDTLNATYDQPFLDLGIIDGQGRHLAYAGPYPLLDKNYRDADWFQAALKKGGTVSDVFLGYRGVPHCIVVAVAREGEQTWMLRATINSAGFDRLVRTGQLGETGDVFIVNAQGVYQTRPRLGKMLTPSGIDAAPHRGVLTSRVEADEGPVLRATAWLNDGQWMLVVQQAEAEVEAPARLAMVAGGLVVALAWLLLAITSWLATRHLTAQIDRANELREQMSRDLMRSAKLASLGELATGLAHEINNPLAIIGAEHTNILDLTAEAPAGWPDRAEVESSAVRIGEQVLRCGKITAKMLQFGHDAPATLEPCLIGPRLEEIVALMERKARLENVELTIDLQADLPPVRLDADELQQVLLNLLNNALQAVRGGGHVAVSARRQGAAVDISVSDDGCGIPVENLERVFSPFFTTKGPGEGTGLGLSVCYGLVTAWGGEIGVQSPGPLGGATFTVRLPAASEPAGG